MSHDFLVSVRAVRSGRFTNRVGPRTLFLKVPSTATEPEPAHKIRLRDWIAEVEAAAAPDGPGCRGDILCFIHGFNTTPQENLERHRVIRQGLAAQGFRGALVSFNWPSAGVPLAYLPDRVVIDQSANRLVQEMLRELARRQRTDCQIDIHVLAHSMGAYLVRQAFYQGERTDLPSQGWLISQLILVSADVSARSLSRTDPRSASLYRHVIRLTNYATPQDEVLSISTVKRLGMSQRAGRVGLPGDHPDLAVNIDCGDHFAATYLSGGRPGRGHNWYFEDALFYRDLFLTIEGALDRNRFPTRRPVAGGGLSLQQP